MHRNVAAVTNRVLIVRVLIDQGLTDTIDCIFGRGIYACLDGIGCVG